MDPQIANLLTGGVIALLPALIVNWYTSYRADKRQEREHRQDVEAFEKQLKAQREALEIRAEYEREALEKQLKEQRKALEIRAGYEDRDRSVRLKLEKVERLYTLFNLYNENILRLGHIASAENRGDVWVSFLEQETQHSFEIDLVCTLYIPEILDDQRYLTEYSSRLRNSWYRYFREENETHDDEEDILFLSYIDRHKVLTKDIFVVIARCQGMLAAIAAAEQKLIHSPSDPTPTVLPNEPQGASGQPPA